MDGLLKTIEARAIESQLAGPFRQVILGYIAAIIVGVFVSPALAQARSCLRVGCVPQVSRN